MESEQEGLNEADLVLVTVLNPANDDTPTSVELPTAFGQQTHIGLNVDGTDPSWSPHDRQQIGGDVDIGVGAFNGSTEQGDIPQNSPGKGK